MKAAFFRRRVGAVAALVLASVAATSLWLVVVDRGSSETHGADAAADGASNNGESVVFFYQKIDPARDESKFEGASAVVTSTQENDRAAVATIHAAGAEAFHYVNVYWFPDDRVYEGIDISRHLDWAFCSAGSRPRPGREVGGTRWYYLDLNERGARSAVFAYLLQLKRLGYDGLFIDRGTPSLRAASSRPLAWEASSCTDHPAMAGAPRFANVFVDFLRAVRSRLGFKIFINYGHPFSGMQLRPDPDDPNCRLRSTTCHFLSDVWKYVDRVVDEHANPATLRGFRAEYATDLADQQGGSHAPAPSRVIRGIKVAANDPHLVLYLWARARLFRVATFINTGDDDCRTTTRTRRSSCVRWGTYPALTRLRLGEPLDPLPQSHDCRRGSTVACVWIRRYEKALVVVNPTLRPRRLTRVPLGVRGCRRLFSVHADGGNPTAVDHAGCISRVSYTVPAQSGGVLIYR